MEFICGRIKSSVWLLQIRWWTSAEFLDHIRDTLLYSKSIIIRGIIWRHESAGEENGHRLEVLLLIGLYLKSSLFGDVTQRTFVVSYRRFGTTYRSHLQGSSFTDCPTPEDGTFY